MADEMDSISSTVNVTDSSENIPIDVTITEPATASIEKSNSSSDEITSRLLAHRDNIVSMSATVSNGQKEMNSSIPATTTSSVVDSEQAIKVVADFVTSAATASANEPTTSISNTTTRSSLFDDDDDDEVFKRIMIKQEEENEKIPPAVILSSSSIPSTEDNNTTTNVLRLSTESDKLDLKAVANAVEEVNSVVAELDHQLQRSSSQVAISNQNAIESSTSDWLADDKNFTKSFDEVVLENKHLVNKVSYHYFVFSLI